MLRYILFTIALLFFGSIADVPVMFLATHGVLSVTFVFIAGFLTDLIPDLFWYWLGARIGVERFEKLPFFKQKPERVEAVGRALDKYGAIILFFSKFVYATGVPTQVVAGAHRYPIKKMLLANSLGAACWLIILYSLATAFSSIDLIERYISDAKIAFLVFVVIVIGLYALLGAPLKRILRGEDINTPVN